MPQYKIGTVGNVSINITIAAIIIFTIVILSISYIVLPYRAEIMFISLISGGAAAIYSAIYAGIALRTRVRQEKMHHSFEFQQLMYDVEQMRWRVKLQKQFDPENTLQKDVYQAILADEDTLISVRLLLNLCENMSIAIQNDYADEATLHQAFLGLVRWVYQTFLPYVEGERKEHNDDKIYCELEKLANSWISKKYLYSGGKIKD